MEIKKSKSPSMHLKCANYDWVRSIQMAISQDHMLRPFNSILVYSDPSKFTTSDSDRLFLNFSPCFPNYRRVQLFGRLNAALFWFNLLSIEFHRSFLNHELRQYQYSLYEKGIMIYKLN